MIVIISLFSLMDFISEQDCDSAVLKIAWKAFIKMNCSKKKTESFNISTYLGMLAIQTK